MFPNLIFKFVFSWWSLVGQWNKYQGLESGLTHSPVPGASLPSSSWPPAHSHFCPPYLVHAWAQARVRILPAPNCAVGARSVCEGLYLPGPHLRARRSKTLQRIQRALWQVEKETAEEENSFIPLLLEQEAHVSILCWGLHIGLPALVLWVAQCSKSSAEPQWACGLLACCPFCGRGLVRATVLQKEFSQLSLSNSLPADIEKPDLENENVFVHTWNECFPGQTPSSVLATAVFQMATAVPGTELGSKTTFWINE